MRFSTFIANKVPLPIKFLQGPFPFIKHKILDLFSSLAHRRELLINFHQLHSKLVLIDNPYQTLQATLSVDILALIFNLVDSIL